MSVGGPHEMGTAGNGKAGGARWAIAFATAYLLIQISIPVVQLFEERPARFGWQMFSGVRTFPTVELVYQDSLVSVDARALVVNNRSDVEFVPHLPRHFCERTPAEAVIVRSSRPMTERVVRCRDR